MRRIDGSWQVKIHGFWLDCKNISHGHYLKALSVLDQGILS